ncbi:MAG: hypothetical protein NTV34_01425 [Proteobacteria bacterium]|nr:hypothetical protein [Pseudomonadota bacterium]
MNDNSWARINGLDCHHFDNIGLDPGQASLNISLRSNVKLALYSFDPLTPAVAFALPSLYGWYDWPPVSIPEASNHGGIWNVSFRKWSLITIFFLASISVVALVGALLKEKPSFAVFGFFGLWCSLAMYQVFATPPLQDPDEPQLISGLFHESMASKTERKDELIGIARKAQYMCEEFSKMAPILPGKVCQSRQFDFEAPAKPSLRSALYGLLLRPLYGMIDQNYVWLKANISLYLGHHFKLMFLCLAIVFNLLFLGALMHSGRILGASVYIMVMSVPVIMSYGTAVTNYAWSTYLGLAFAVLQIPEGRRPQFWRLVSPWLGGLAACFATSQPPLALMVPIVLALNCWAGATDIKSKEYRCSLLWMFLSVIAAFASLRLLLGVNWLGEAGRLTKVFLDHLPFRDVAFISPFVSTFASEMVLRIGAIEGVLVLECIVLYLVLGFGPAFFGFLKGGMPKRFLKPPPPVLKFFIAFGPALSIYGVALFVISQPEYVSSLASIEKPPFLIFLKSIVRALISQLDEIVQDYFYVKTFFMAYGWFDTTGPDWIYFLLRTFVQTAILIVWAGFILRLNRKTLYPIALICCFFGYLLALTFANWVDGLTMTGRFSFPGIGLLAVGLVLGVSRAFRPNHWRNFGIGLCFGVTTLFALASVYGQQIILVRRFLVGGL